MAAYVVLFKFTEQGSRNIRDTVTRAAEVQAELEQRGLRMLGLYWTQGEYDLVSIIESPDEPSLMAGMLSISEAGNARSQTMRAFTAAEMQQIIERM